MLEFGRWRLDTILAAEPHVDKQRPAGTGMISGGPGTIESGRLPFVRRDNWCDAIHLPGVDRMAVD